MTVSKKLQRKLLSGVSAGAVIASLGTFSIGELSAADVTLINNIAQTIAGTSNTIATSFDGGFLFIDAKNDATASTAIITNDATIRVGSTNGTDDPVIITASTISAGKTLTVVLGVNAAGASVANRNVGDMNLVGLTGATANVGTVIVQGADTIAGIKNSAANTVTIGAGSATSLDTLTVRGGNGNVLTGADLTVSEIGTATRGVSVTTLTLSGGTGGSSVASKNGGALIVTELTGDVSGTTYTIQGGDGGSGNAVIGGAGGAATLTEHTGDVASTTFNLEGGAGAQGLIGKGGDGGVLTITTFAGAINATTTNLRGGAGADGAVNDLSGVGGDGGKVDTSAIASLIGVVGTPVTFNIDGGIGGDGGAAGAAAAGGAGGVGGAITALTLSANTFADVTITGGAGGTGGIGNGVAVGGGAAVGGAVTITDHTATTTGALVIDGGDGGAAGTTGSAFAGGVGANGGAVTLSDFGAVSGSATFTSGDGGDAGDGSTAVVGAIGGDGGLIVATGGSGIDSFTGSAAATGGNMTVTAGNAGDGGNAGTTGNGGEGGAGGNNTIVIQGTGDFNTLAIAGGAGGDGGDGGTGANGDGGAAGAAGAAVFTQTGNAEATILTVTGGNAGNAGNHIGGVAGSTGTIGTAGGAATATVTGTLDGNGAASTTITVTGGSGGNGGNGDAAQAGIGGVAGGAATLSLTAASIANITLDDGSAGTAGTTTTAANVGGAAGAGGVAKVRFVGGAAIQTGNIFAASNGEGTVEFNGATDFIGSIGVDGTGVKLLDISAAVATSVSGNIFATNVNFTIGAGTLTFDGLGTTTQTVSGNILNGSGAGIIVAGATAPVHFKGTVAAATLTLIGTGTVQFEDTVTTATDFNVASGTTITLGEGIVAGETVVTATQAGSAIATAATINLPQTFTSGSITLIDYVGASTGAADALLLTLNESVLATYTAGVGSDATKLDITASKKSSSSIATALGISATEAVHLDAANSALVTGDAAALTALNGVLIAGGASAKLAAETIGLQADTLGASASAAMSTGGAVSGIASNRLASLRSNVGEQYASAGQETGFNAGSGAMSKNFWMKGFGTFAEQDASGGIAGYDADTTGFSAGFDMETSRNYRLGASIGISNTDVDGEGAGKAIDAIASKQFTVYGDYTTSNYFLEGSLGYAMNSSDKQRTITIGTLVRTASAADVDSDQFMVNVSGGMPLSLGGSTVFTPRAGMAYTLLKTDNYTETGAVNLNQTVVTDDVSSFILSIGGKVHTKIPTQNGNFVPSFHAGVSYDTSGDEVVSQSTFTGGGPSTTNTGAEQEQFAGNFGGGLAYEVDEASVGITYDLSMKDGYSAHSGMLEAQFKF